jgi:hypothetical protein
MLRWFQRDPIKVASKMKHDWERNHFAVELEMQGKTQAAIAVYESLLAQRSETYHPYQRLADYFHGVEDYGNEVRVLKQAVAVQEETVARNVPGARSKLDEARSRLDIAQNLLAGEASEKAASEKAASEKATSEKAASENASAG